MSLVLFTKMRGLTVPSPFHTANIHLYLIKTKKKVIFFFFFDSGYWGLLAAIRDY